MTFAERPQQRLLLEQSAWARGQRVRNRQPLGGLIGLGSSPRIPTSVLAFSAAGSGIGIVLINASVYGCAGRR